MTEIIPVPLDIRQLIDTKTHLSGSPRDDQYLGFNPLPYRIVWIKQASFSSAPMLFFRNTLCSLVFNEHCVAVVPNCVGVA